MRIELYHPRAEDLLGFIPSFLSEADPRPASEQINERYAHGGGWSPMKGWHTEHRTGPNGDGTEGKRLFIQYPGDPAYQPVAMIQLRDEKIWVYQHAWVAIENAEGVEVARMD